MSRKKKTVGVRILNLCCLTVLIASILVAGGLVVVTGLSLETVVENEMIALSDQISDEIEASIDGDFKYLEGLATSNVVYDMQYSATTQKQILINIAEDRGYRDIGFISSNGQTITAAMQQVNLSEREYYIQSMAGNRYCTDPMPDSTQEGVMLIMVSVPVYENGDSTTGNVIGVLYAVMPGEYLSDITNEVSFGETGMAYMINDEGTNIAYTDTSVVLAQQNAINEFADDPDFDSLIAMLNEAKSNDSGCTTYEYNGDKKYVGYKTVGDYGWHVLVCADQSELFRGEVQSIVLAVLITIGVLIVAIITTLFFVRRMVAPLVRLNELNGALSEGDLSKNIDVENDAKVNDEIGQMVMSTDTFVSKLKDVISTAKNSATDVHDISSTLKDLANQSEEAADNVCKAIEDVAQATVQQATEVESATQEVTILGDAVDNISQGVTELLELAKTALDAEESSQAALNELINSNSKTTIAFNEISEQINATGVATQKISDAANLITEIASQTNLLSLNASIEAARAGEAGKGFAVVATEIQQLSVQSDDAANTIQEIINELTEGSNKSIKKMEETMVLITEQQERLTRTEEESSSVNENVVAMESSAQLIKDNVGSCEGVKNHLNDVITNLSGISEENAASAEQTNAAMQELNANVGIIAESAKNLSGIAKDLNADMDFWSLEAKDVE